MGLQNIMIGTEKYNTTEVKARIFMDKLNEARRAFLNDFLQREIRRVSQDLGFRNIPTAKFVDMDSKDQTELLRITTRLMELGILTPQQGLGVFNTGKFPDSEEIGITQEEFVKDRKKGFYNPLVGGVPLIAPAVPKTPAGAPAPAPAGAPPNGVSNTNQTPKSPGRPTGKTAPSKTIKGYSRKNIQEVVGKVEELRKNVETEVKKKYKTKNLNENQSKIVDSLCEAIVCATDMNQWNEEAKSCVNEIDKIEKLKPLEDVLNISIEHELNSYPSAILYHSEKLK
jgi:hypothetical protein